MKINPNPYPNPNPNLSLDHTEGTSEKLNRTTFRTIRNCSGCNLNFCLTVSESERAVSCENIDCLVTLCHSCQPMNFRACDSYYCENHKI